MERNISLLKPKLASNISHDIYTKFYKIILVFSVKKISYFNYQISFCSGNTILSVFPSVYLHVVSITTHYTSIASRNFPVSLPIFQRFLKLRYFFGDIYSVKPKILTYLYFITIIF